MDRLVISKNLAVFKTQHLYLQGGCALLTQGGFSSYFLPGNKSPHNLVA